MILNVDKMTCEICPDEKPIANGQVCYACASGKYYNEEKNICEACPLGTEYNEDLDECEIKTPATIVPE